MPLVSPSAWEAFLAAHPNAHLLQTRQWGQLKAAFGWETVHVIAGETGGATGAQILFRRLPLGFTFAYIPKGPVGDGWENLLPDMDAACRARRALALKIEPDQWAQPGSGGAPPPGFIPSPHAIQPPRTIVMDISGNEAQILARMKQKTRYNIRLAEKKGVVVRPSNDLETWDRLMQETGARDGFGVHTRAYYQQAYDLFHPAGACELLLAEYEGEPLAGIMVFARGKRAWYLYGASASAHREKMPAYLLQWAGICWARARGCTQYDLWGVPDEDEQTLEANFLERSDGLWGVYRFKRGFGGQVKRAAGPWDRVYWRGLYWAYRSYALRNPGAG